jgi:dephospho-CoA kinase
VHVRLIGLTGGIASGKTTVHRMLETLGASVLDADRIYHDLIAPRDGRPSELGLALAARFPGVIDGSGRVDRQALGARVFASPRERRALNALTHPAVAHETARRIAELEAQGVPLVFYDVPLLFEAGLADSLREIIVVWTSAAIQIERLMSRDRLERREAEARLAAQLPLDEKRQRATWVIDSSGTLEETRAQVETLWRELHSSALGV